MCENFIIAERYKLQDFMSFHFMFIVNYIRDKNALYSTDYLLKISTAVGNSFCYYQLLMLCYTTVYVMFLYRIN